MTNFRNFGKLHNEWKVWGLGFKDCTMHELLHDEWKNGKRRGRKVTLWMKS